ncbi:polysaccharide deacetylase family protein [Vallitalea pronyensis]|uniref:Polysaccharide deacetylase family protein n=1 Tax=Vallitalea pronyensis TaxID=1348613 RepID=A0A8J8SIM6_9FIRM|nr:polysaccharide deacetylase family protein [Vallitalea pronyensis]QUI24761.1 polysaccharide deacetylase family protein [Vallitalea pronyensis]
MVSGLHKGIIKKLGGAICIMLLVLLVVGCGEERNQPQEKEQMEEHKQPEEQDVKPDPNDELPEDDAENDTEKQDDQVVEEVTKPKEIDYQVVKPNELGHIMVIMYHGILDNYPYHVTEEQFLKDLQYMYEKGYRPISMRDYLDNHITVEAGYTPIVLTFDDGLESTFSMVEENGELVPKTGTAVEIMERFAKDYPEFGKEATFYINGGKIFDGAGTVEERLNWLVDNGYGLGNHTATHKHLGKSGVTSRDIMAELGKVDQLIKNAIPGYTVDSITYPFGARPKEALRAFIKEGEFDGNLYQYQVGFREGASGPYYPPLHTKFSPLNVARARGSEGEAQDMWWFFDYYEKHPEKKYISDGRADRVSILEGMEEYMNKEKLGDKELFTYKIESEE